MTPIDEEYPEQDEHIHIDEEAELILSISRNEALFLDDSITLMIERHEDEPKVSSMRPVQMTAGLAVPLDLMDKIGKAVVYTTNPDNQGKDYKVSLYVSEVFMIREVSQSFIKIGDEPVGFNLKRKVCTLLYADDLAQENRDEQISKLLKDVDVDLETSIPDEVADSKLTNTRDGEV